MMDVKAWEILEVISISIITFRKIVVCCDDLFENNDDTVITIVQEQDLLMIIMDEGQLNEIPTKIVFVHDDL